MNDKNKWRHQVTTGLGFFIIVLPFLGFPSTYHQIIFVIIGLLIAGLGLTGSRLSEESVKENRPQGGLFDSIN